MKVLVCGGRNYVDYIHLRAVLDALHAAKPITEVIHGGARGADDLANHWARTRGIARKVFPAAWGEHGKAAGMIRNRAMLTDGKPDMVVAFPGGKGTANMMALARKAGLGVMTVGERTE